jgi:hypothetical protein
VHDTENCCVGTDAESKSQDGDGSEARILPQNSGSIAGILPTCLEIGEVGHLAGDLSSNRVLQILRRITFAR